MVQLSADGGTNLTAISAGGGGRLLVAGTVRPAGSVGTDAYVLRLDAAGRPDASFAPGGTRTIDLGSADDQVGRVHIDGAGRIVVTGSTSVDGATSVAAARLVGDPVGTVAGTVYEDRNGNGRRDSGEPALAGRAVYADLDGDRRPGAGEPATVTGADGTYRLAVPAGDRDIRQALPAGWQQSEPGRAQGPTADYPGQQVTVVAGGVTGASFGSFRPASVSGEVYNDRNGDGVRGPGEEGVGGFTVYSDDNGNNARDGTDRAALTDNNGRYVFAGLSPGTELNLLIAPRAGWIDTNARRFQYTVTSGSDFVGRDNFAVTQKSIIVGRVFGDDNRNGEFDAPAERGIAGRTVWLDLDENGTLDAGEPSAVTESGFGFWRIGGLSAGTYLVRTLPPTGLVATPLKPGGTPRTYYATVDGSAYRVTVGPLTYAGTHEFGFAAALPPVPPAPGRIAGFVYNDADGDGRLDSGENVLVPGRVAYLDANRNGALDAGERSFTTQVDGF